MYSMAIAKWLVVGKEEGMLLDNDLVSGRLSNATAYACLWIGRTFLRTATRISCAFYPNHSLGEYGRPVRHDHPVDTGNADRVPWIDAVIVQGPPNFLPGSKASGRVIVYQFLHHL